MKNIRKNLLPKKSVDRDALSNTGSKTKPRFKKVSEGLWRLTNISKVVLVYFLVVTILGYQPVLSFPPLQKSVVKADSEGLFNQSQEVFSDYLPETQLPHPGYLSTPFSQFHPGIDLATKISTPIHPITEGVVEGTFYGYFGYGNHVIVAHEKGFKSLYGHMGNIFVKPGQKVNKDTILGTVGLTGFTSGPHTHLEITQNGNYIDPRNILPKIQDYPSAEYINSYEEEATASSNLAN